MEINGRTRTCGLIGNPVEHTLSPVIHNTLAERFGHNLVYVPFPVEAGRIGEAVAGASALQILGLNVTVPYKGEVFPACGKWIPWRLPSARSILWCRCRAGSRAIIRIWKGFTAP